MCVSGANESKCIHEVGLSDLDLILVWPKTEKQISEDTHYYKRLLSWSLENLIERKEKGLQDHLTMED